MNTSITINIPGDVAKQLVVKYLEQQGFNVGTKNIDVCYTGEYDDRCFAGFSCVIPLFSKVLDKPH